MLYGTPDLDQEPEKTLEWNAPRLIFQRKGSRLSHKQLAEAMGVSQKQIICMENCTRIPSKEVLEMLTSFFDVPDDYFGVEALGGNVKVKPPPFSPQDERQQAARASLTKQRHTLRKMMKIAGFPLNCTGLNRLADVLDEPVSDICKFVNGELTMPPDTVQKANKWFLSIRKVH